MNVILHKLLRTVSATVGLLAVIAAIMAYELGLDTNPSWGPSRYLLLFVGAGLLGVSVYPSVRRLLERAFQKLRTPINQTLASTPAKWVRSRVRHLDDLLRKFWTVWRETFIYRNAQRFSKKIVELPPLSFLLSSRWRAAISFTFLMLIPSFTFYYWLVTLGRIDGFPAITSHFSLLAEGFAKGQLHLPLQPSPELLASPNPYALEARPFMPPVWDISYFGGKFYLYWGPIPAVITLVLQTLFQVAISDSLLVFSLALTTAIIGACILLAIWRRLFARLPAWTVIPPILVMVLGIPLPWLLSRPSVYEAAIISGQCFFLLGMFLLLPVFFEEEISRCRLLLASLSLGLAIGSRLTLLPASLFLLAAALIIKLLQESTGLRHKLSISASMLMPLATIGFTLLLYNFARFGDPFESGHIYQLGRWNMYDNYFRVVSLKNAIPNLYNYFLNPPNFLTVFPYIKPAWGEYYIWPAHYYAPEMYHTEHLTGILVGIPFIWFGLNAVKAFVAQAIEIIKGRLTLASWQYTYNRHVVLPAVLFATSCLLLAPLMLFIAASMRHMTDVVPSLVFLASIGFWQAYRNIQLAGKSTLLLSLLGWSLSGLSVAAGILLSFTGSAARFEQLNPELYQQVIRLFTP